MNSLDSITQEEWEVAEHYLNTAPNGTKIKRTKGKTKYTHPTTGKNVKLKHSFIKIEDNIYALASGEYLGKGSFGKVKLIKDKNKELFAIKISEEINQKEADIAKDLRVEKARPISRIGSRKKYHIMEYLGTNFSDFLDRNYLNNSQKLDFSLQCVTQVDDFHTGKASVSNTKRMHRDIKEDNFVIRNGKIFLIDFGLSTEIKNSNQNVFGTMCGTDGYMAPEVYKYHTSVNSDIYSLGVVLDNINKGNKNIEHLSNLMKNRNPKLRPDLDLVKAFLLVELNNSNEALYKELNITSQQAKAITVAMLCSKSDHLYDKKLINDIKNNPCLCNSLAICYDYLRSKNKDLFSSHGKETTEKLVVNLLKNPIFRSEKEIKGEVANYLSGKGKYGTWYGGSSRYNKEGSRVSYMYEGGFFKNYNKPFSKLSKDELKELENEVKSCMPNSIGSGI